MAEEQLVKSEDIVPTKEILRRQRKQAYEKSKLQQKLLKEQLRLEDKQKKLEKKVKKHRKLWQTITTAADLAPGKVSDTP